MLLTQNFQLYCYLTQEKYKKNADFPHEKNAELHTPLTCLGNMRCESTSTLRSWGAGVGDVI